MSSCHSATFFRAVLVLCLSGFAPCAFGLANRVFVSARSGNDANSCDNVATPCQTFAGAVTQLNPGGEAIVLDSGGYGKVTITQSLTIEAPPGVVAFIHPSSGGAIAVSASSADTVILRGLVLNGGPSQGIVVNTVGTLQVENCVISGFSSYGLFISVSGDNQVFVSDTVFCGNSTGIFVHTNGGGTTTMTVGRSRFENNVARGIEMQSGKAVIKDSVASGNGNIGLAVFNDAQMTIENCAVAHNPFAGVLGNTAIGAGYVVHVSNSTITNNGIGLDRLSTGTLASRGNNTIENNGTDLTVGVTTYTGR